MAHRQKTINDFFGNKSSGTTPASQGSRKRTHEEAFDDTLPHFSLNLPPSPTSTSPQNRLSPQLSVSPSNYRAPPQTASSLAPRTLFPPEPKRQKTTGLFLDDNDDEIEEQLTPEELERIERNKQAALARKKAAELAGVNPIVMSQTPKAIKVIPPKTLSSPPSASQPAPLRKPIVLASPSKVPTPKLVSSQAPSQTQKQTPVAVPMVVETIDDEEDEPKVSSFFGSTSPTSSPRPLRLGRFSPRSVNSSQNSSQGSSQGSQTTSLSPIESLTPTSPQHSSNPPAITIDPSPPKTHQIPQPRTIPSTASTSSSSSSKSSSSCHNLDQRVSFSFRP